MARRRIAESPREVGRECQSGDSATTPKMHTLGEQPDCRPRDTYLCSYHSHTLTFNKHLLSTYLVPVAILDPWATSVNKHKYPPALPQRQVEESVIKVVSTIQKTVRWSSGKEDKDH